jgi:hypothetical protein
MELLWDNIHVEIINNNVGLILNIYDMVIVNVGHYTI